jgi:hypothetical protein
MPQIRCPHITCQHNTSDIVQQPGFCTYSGILEMENHEDEHTEQQYLACKQYAGYKRIKDLDPRLGVGRDGTQYTGVA